MGAKVSSGKKELSEKDLAYFTQHTGLQKEQVLYDMTWPLINGLGTTHAISLSETSHVIHRTSCTAESKQQSFLIGPEQREKEKGKPGHNTWIMRGSFWLVQIISCSVRGSRLLLEDQNTDCTLIPNPIDLRGWVSCTQFQENSLTSGHVFVQKKIKTNVSGR